MAPPVAAEIYSHSRLSSFEDCPKKFEYRYLQQVPVETESIEAFVGKQVHSVLERLFDFVDRGQVPSLNKVLQRFGAWWEEKFQPERIRIVRRENGPEHYRKLGERCLQNFYRQNYPFDGDETLGIEQRVAFTLDAEKGYRMQGFVDRVVRAKDGAIEIHDYKTSARVPSQQQLDRDRQLALYQIGLHAEHGDDQPIRLVWHYLAAGRVCNSARSPEQLDALRRDTVALIDRIRAATEWPARPGPLCAWCEYNHICPDAPEPRS